MTPKTPAAAWPSWAGRAAVVWSLLYATGAALAAVTAPAFGYSLLGKGTGTGPEAAAAALYGTAAVLAYALLRRPGVRWLSTAAWAVVALCLTSGFAALLSPLHLLFFLSRNQPPVDWAALANQTAAVLGGILWACAALAHRRHALGTCPYCGRHPGGRRAGDRPTGRDGWAHGTAPSAAPPHPAPAPRADLAPRAGLVAVAALVPYTVLKTAWALGVTPGYTGTGRPGVDPEYTSDLGIRLYDHGVDVTAVLALLGMTLALALTRPWGRRLPRLPLLALGWAGAGALAPFGVFLAAVGALAWAGAVDVGMADHAPWVVAVAYGSFSGYGLALARATRAHQRATRRPCERC
ncbi:hypothetical protein [Streptomyces viridochromogenes]|uniref:Uncharacterized protein n=1 Tax=Streptomyces viridochromogenes TaxID=1938 RepID=A0A0L8KWH1_STRVR|nr:hypothetical protein [Streptomyces viridochromogenes]KOG30308.1 hypothetical protein ADK34_12310 [Streptomyces viridochromogenes]